MTSRTNTPFDTFLCPHCSNPIFNVKRQQSLRLPNVPSASHQQPLMSYAVEQAYPDPVQPQPPAPPHSHYDSPSVNGQEQSIALQNPNAQPGSFYDSVYNTYRSAPYQYGRLMEDAPKFENVEGIGMSTSREGSMLPTAKEQEQQDTPAKHPREGWEKWRFPGMQIAFSLCCIMLGYDVSNIANIQPPIYEAFGHVELLPWVSMGYTAMNVCLVPLARRLVFVESLKWQVMVYTIIFFVGCVVSGSATGMNSVIIGRVVTGIGGAGLYQVALVCNVVFSTPTELPRIQGLMGITWALGLVLGPIIGGAFAENSSATWRWALYINLPILGIIMVILYFVMPNTRLDASPVLAGLLGIDWLGFIFHVAGFVLLCCALIFSGSIWPWSSSSAIVAWVFVGVIYIAYVLQQYFNILVPNRQRIFPGDLYKSRVVALISASTWVAGCTYGTTLYYTPLFFAFTRGFSPIDAAVRLLPYIFTFIVFTIISSILLPVIRLYAPFYIFGGALVLIGAALQTTIDPNTSPSAVMGHTALIGSGVGCLWQTGVAVITQAVPPARKLDASALFIMMQLGGTALTLALAGCVFQNVGFNFLKDVLGGSDFNDDDIRQALAGVDSRIWDEADAEVMELAVEAVTKVIARLFYIVLAAGAMAFLCGCLMPWKKLEFGKTQQKGNNTEVEVEHEDR